MAEAVSRHSPKTRNEDRTMTHKTPVEKAAEVQRIEEQIGTREVTP